MILIIFLTFIAGLGLFVGSGNEAMVVVCSIIRKGAAIGRINDGVKTGRGVFQNSNIGS